MVEVVDKIGWRRTPGLSVRFVWGKAYAGIPENESADRFAKAGCRPSLLSQVTKGGIWAM